MGILRGIFNLYINPFSTPADGLVPIAVINPVSLVIILPKVNSKQWLQDLHLALEGRLVKGAALVVLVPVEIALPEVALVVALVEDQAQLELHPAM